jgi:uncharacterized membrane protein
MPRGREQGWAGAVMIGCLTGIALTADRLPARVASHFDASGHANGFVTRPVYLAFTIGLVVLLSALVGVLIGVSVRHFPEFLNLPNRDYWLAPERRDETADCLAAHAAWFAALCALLALGIHLLVIRANLIEPPQLESGRFLAVLLVFAGAMVVWLRRLVRRFARD